MLSDREKRELAQVFATVLEPRIRELQSEIASGFVCILECAIADLAKIFAARSVEMQNMMEQFEKLRDTRKTGKTGFVKTR